MEWQNLLMEGDNAKDKYMKQFFESIRYSDSMLDYKARMKSKNYKKKITMRKYILYLLAILLAACSKSVPYSDETIKNELACTCLSVADAPPASAFMVDSRSADREEYDFHKRKESSFCRFPAGGRNDVSFYG